MSRPFKNNNVFNYPPATASPARRSFHWGFAVSFHRDTNGGGAASVGGFVQELSASKKGASWRWGTKLAKPEKSWDKIGISTINHRCHSYWSYKPT